MSYGKVIRLVRSKNSKLVLTRGVSEDGDTHECYNNSRRNKYT